MGQFQAGSWIIGILIYYVCFFLLIASVQYSFSTMYDTSNDLQYNDPGFSERFNIYDLQNGECRGKVKKNILGNYYCKQFEDLNDDLQTDITEEECNFIPGCAWENATLLLGIQVFDAQCSGNVNITSLGLEDNTTTSTFCQQLQNETYCDALHCIWLNPNDLANERISDLEGKNFLSVTWESIKFVTTFRADFDLGRYGWVISLVFFYFPLVMLLYAIYMALPFLH